MTELAKLTKTQRENYHYMADAMRRLEWDLHHTIEQSRKIPVGWHAIAEQRYPKRKVRVTMLLEEDVVRFFKSMGTGYQGRMNEVLRVWMHGRLAGIIRGADTMDYYKRRVVDLECDGPRPEWGEVQAEEDRMAEEMGRMLGEG